MVDLVEAMKALMLARPALAALVSNRVYPHALPEGFPKGPDAARAIVVKDTKESSVAKPVAHAVLLVEAYGRTAAEANEVWRAVCDALHEKQNLTGGGRRWMGTWIDEDGETAVTEKTKWHVKVFKVHGMTAA